MELAIIAFCAQIPACILAIIGYLSLRYKASAENVMRLESEVTSLQLRVASLEKDVEECHQSRLRLVGDKTNAIEALAETKVLLAAKSAAVTLLEKASIESDKLGVSGNSLKENTIVTKEIATAVAGIVDDVAKLTVQTNGLTKALMNAAVDAERNKGIAEAATVADTVELARQRAELDKDLAVEKARHASGGGLEEAARVALKVCSDTTPGCPLSPNKETS